MRQGRQVMLTATPSWYSTGGSAMLASGGKPTAGITPSKSSKWAVEKPTSGWALRAP
jgi:hypothetical protein